MKYLKKLNGRRGYSDEELGIIKTSLNVKLPEAYIEFLKIAGKGYGFKDKENYSFLLNDEYEGIKKAAQGIINCSNIVYDLKENDFVFYYQEFNRFAFFNLEEGDDPPVYGFKIAQINMEPILINKKFSNFIVRFEKRSDLFSKEVIINMVRFKEIMRILNYPNFDYSSINVKLDQVEIPQKTKQRINHYFRGIKKELVKKMVIDLVMEKNDFDGGIYNAINALLEIVNGDFYRFQQNYYYQVRSSDSTPQWWIDELKSKVSS